MAMKTIKLGYGQGKIEFQLESNQILGIVQSAKTLPLEDVKSRFEIIFKNPIDSLPLNDIVKQGEKIAVLVSDKTRETKVDVILPYLLDFLNRSGIPDKDIFIIFAVGSHPKQTRKEMVNIIGHEAAERVDFFEHDSNDTENLKYVGTTKAGTRIELNKQALEADRIIATGAIVYHYFAGYGGGRKSIVPGIASSKTTKSNHSLILNREDYTGINSYATTGILKGNPIHEDMLEAMGMIDVDFLVNAVLDDDDRLVELFAGNPISAHQAGCRYVNNNSRVVLKESADVVIVSPGGYPKDIDFIQSHKAIENSFQACRKGGTLILLAACQEKYPSDQYLRWFELESYKKIEEILFQDYSVPGQTVYSILKKANDMDIILVSEFNEEEVNRMGLKPASSINEALEMTFRKIGKHDLRYYIVPQGKHTFSVCCK